MSYIIVRSIIRDIRPTRIGGIINIDKGEILFNNNIVSNVISSTYAACFYATNSNICIKDSCFTYCAGSGGNEKPGNIGYIQKSNVKILRISAYLCSFSTSQSADSVFRFVSCSTSMIDYNSSFCYGVSGAAGFTSVANITAYTIKFMICLSGVDWSFVECNHIATYEKCSFINSSKMTGYMVASTEGSVFDTCCFFPMNGISNFRGTITLKNCWSDVSIKGYYLTVYSTMDEANIPILKKPLCRETFGHSYTRKRGIMEFFLIMILYWSY